MFYLIWYGLVTLDFTSRIFKSLPHFRLLSIPWPALQAGKKTAGFYLAFYENKYQLSTLAKKHHDQLAYALSIGTQIYYT